MLVLLIMCVGVIVGGWFFPQKYKKLNEKIQVVCTILLIFSMGVMLGRQDNLLEQIAPIGLTSLLFAILPILASIILVYFLTKRFMKNKEE